MTIHAHNFRSVLILEDESLVSMMVEEMVRALGAEQVHSFNSADLAREQLLRGDVDCAILDVMLRGNASFELADMLEERGIPFVFSTGTDLESIEERHRHRPFLSKPFGDDQLRDSLYRALAARQECSA